MAKNKSDLQMRQRLAQEAARVLLESGSRDFALAKRKAAEHLAAHDTRNLPTNIEIEEALAEYQRLFRSEDQPAVLRKLREIAYEAMQFFAEFNPRLVGPVLSGTADTNTTISLHVFSDTFENVSLLLINNNIPFENQDKRLRIGQDNYDTYPAITFFAEGQQIEIVVFSKKHFGVKPISPVDGKPMQRANLTEVEMLLNSID